MFCSRSQLHKAMYAFLTTAHKLLTRFIQNVPPGNQRVDEVPVVQTKAKMNQILSRGSTTDFGMDSMFQSSRFVSWPLNSDRADDIFLQTTSDSGRWRCATNKLHKRHPYWDESWFWSQPFPAKGKSRTISSDPLAFINDQQKTTVENAFSSSRRHTRTSSITQIPQHTFVVVFGYPADKFSLTAEYFKSLGEATEPEKHLEITNCFRIGYVDIGDAMRAVRKNGEIFGGSWMIGTKWAVSIVKHYTRHLSFLTAIRCVLSGPCPSRSNDRATSPSQYPDVCCCFPNERHNLKRKWNVNWWAPYNSL